MVIDKPVSDKYGLTLREAAMVRSTTGLEPVRVRPSREWASRAPEFAVPARAHGRGSAATRIAHATELRAAEARHTSSERQFRALFERAPDALFVADDDGRYVDANPAASILLGRPGVPARSSGARTRPTKPTRAG